MPRAAATPPTPDALPGLGPKSRDMLASIGIHTAAQLQTADPYAVYARLHATLPNISLNLLYGLIGAIENRPWQDVAREQRTEILLRLDAMGIAPGQASPHTERFRMNRSEDRRESSWIALILDSYQQLLGQPLVDMALTPDEKVTWLRDQAPFCLLAHDASADPLFVYANAATLRCFGFTHAEFIGMPSRLSAEAPRREEREALLADVARQGFSTGYRGLRIGKQGQRFWIEDVTVWNLIENGERVGQAATYRRITPVQL